MPRFALGLAALALVLVTTACDDDPEPKIADPTSEPTTEPTASDPPASSGSPKPLSPEETVRAWIDGLSMAFTSGEFANVEALSSPDCDTCEDFVEPVRETFSNGGSYRTTPIRIVSLKAKPREKTTVDVALVFPAGVLIESGGASPTRYPSSQEILEFSVKEFAGGSTVVTSVLFLS